MKVQLISSNKNSELIVSNELRELLESLFEFSAITQDRELKKLYNENVVLKNNRNDKLTELKNKKELFDQKTVELARLKILNRILKMILELKSKGKLLGKTSEVINSLLKDIEKKDFQTLRKLEEKIYSFT